MIKTTREEDNYEEFEQLSTMKTHANGDSFPLILEKYHTVVDTADDLVELANKNIDRYIKEKQAGKSYEREIEKAFSLKHDEAPGTRPSENMISRLTKNYLAKPQNSFEEKMDNSYFQFVPIITHKENAKTPLHKDILRLQEEAKKYKEENPQIEYMEDVHIPIIEAPHPYEQEITDLKINWKKMLNEITDLTPKFPDPVEESESDFDFIDKESQLDQFMSEISN